MIERVGGDLVQLHRSWLEGVTLDDQLWFQSIIASQSQELRLQGGLPHNNRWIWKILQLGYIDGREADRPWDASTRSMRYTTIVGDWIQANIELERGRVSDNSIGSFQGRLIIGMLLERSLGSRASHSEESLRCSEEAAGQGC